MTRTDTHASYARTINHRQHAALPTIARAICALSPQTAEQLLNAFIEVPPACPLLERKHTAMPEITNYRMGTAQIGPVEGHRQYVLISC